MDANRIEDNSSYRNIKKQMQGLEIVAKAGKFLSFLGIKSSSISELISNLPEMKRQLEVLSKGPDKFNHHFSALGWIAHESMNVELMQQAIELADRKQLALAEERLIAYYSSNEMHWLISRLYGTDEFRIRLPLLNLAYRDTLEGRYHSVVPIVLMMIDGAVNDISKSKGFFAENTGLTAWDSIAAHSSGLAQLQKTFAVGRPSTIETEIDIPFRNGILHGRDLGYANQKVTAKSWAALFAVNDWARTLASGKGVKPNPEPEPSFKQEFKKLRENSRRVAESKKSLEKVLSWTKREIIVGATIPESGLSSDYIDFTPEQEAIRFAENWAKKNYGNIGKQIHSYKGQTSADKKNAGKARAALEGKTLKGYKIESVNDIAAAISEVTLELLISKNEQEYTRSITLRLLYEDANGDIMTFGDTGGQWKFFGGALEEISNPL